MYSDKRLFVGLCVTVWFINTCMAGAATLFGIWLGLGISLISVPVWALLGTAFPGVRVISCLTFSPRFPPRHERRF
jgi:type IV secretory pathway TrbL component